MKYEILKSKFYSMKPKAYNDEVKARRAAYSSLRFPFSIKDFNTRKEFDAFLVCTYEQSVLIEKIYLCSAELNNIFSRFPDGVRQYYYKQWLINEVQNTNEIENIHSTRKEIGDVIDAIKKKRNAGKQRFKGMIRKYLLLLNDEVVISLHSSTDIRKLYDEVVLDEINADDFPDGTIFRKQIVFIDDSHGDHIHCGITPEDKLIEFIDKAIETLNNEELPILVRIAIFHYLFAYAHPFYDGNGRLNRFIMSGLLFQKVNKIIGLAASAELKMIRQDYYKAFRTCNDGRNSGDLTPFVIQFLEFILSAAQRVEAQIKDGDTKLRYYLNVINKIERILSGKAKDKKIKASILQVFVLAALFADKNSRSFKIQDLMTYSEVGSATTRKLISELIDVDRLPIKKDKDGNADTFFIEISDFDQHIQHLINVGDIQLEDENGEE